MASFDSTEEVVDDRQKNCLEKLTWDSAESARAAATYAGWQYGRQAVRPQPYNCRYCGKWHLARSQT